MSSSLWTLWTVAHQVSLSFTISQSLLKFMSTEWVMPSSHLIICHTLLLLTSIFLSIQVFSKESALRIMWPKYCPSSEYSGLISSRIDWFGFLAVQGTHKCLLYCHNLKASVLCCSDFFMVQLSHPYIANRKTIALTIWTFVDKVTSLHFNTLFRFVIAFL